MLLGGSRQEAPRAFRPSYKESVWLGRSGGSREDARGRGIGWLHVARTAHLTGDADAEILGLVVGESMRGGGIGADLLRAAEDWARSHGAAQLHVRSRVERERAHRFYERAGFTRIKTQTLFRKSLA